MQNGGIDHFTDLLSGAEAAKMKGKANGKLANGKGPTKKQSKTNDKVQNYLNTLEDPFMIEDEIEGGSKPPR